MGLPHHRVDPDPAVPDATVPDATVRDATVPDATDRDDRVHALVKVAWQRWHRRTGGSSGSSTGGADAISEFELDPGVVRVQSVIDAIAAERRTAGTP